MWFWRIHKSTYRLCTCISLLPVLIFRMQITLSHCIQVEALLPLKRPARAICPAQIRATAPGVKYSRKSPCAPQPNLHDTLMSVVCTSEELKKETINYSPVDKTLRSVCVYAFMRTGQSERNSLNKSVHVAVRNADGGRTGPYMKEEDCRNHTSLVSCVKLCLWEVHGGKCVCVCVWDEYQYPVFSPLSPCMGLMKC